MNPKFLIPTLLFCGLCFAAQADVQQNQSAEPKTETKNINRPAAEALQLARSIDEAVRAEMKKRHVTEGSDPKITADIARQEIMPHIAKETIARLVAGPQAWKTATPADRKEFRDALTDTMIKAYAAALTSYSTPTAKQDFSPPRTSNTAVANAPLRVEIRSIITTELDAPRLHVSYRFIKEPGSDTFKVYDINGENISLVKSYRSQIQPKISNGESLHTIAQELRQHSEKPKNS